VNNTASIVPLNGSLAKEDEPYFKLKHDFHEGIDFRVYAHSLVSVERQISKAYNYTGIKIQRNHLAVTHVQKGCIETYIHEMWNQLPGVVQPSLVNYQHVGLIRPNNIQLNWLRLSVKVARL